MLLFVARLQHMWVMSEWGKLKNRVFFEKSRSSFKYLFENLCHSSVCCVLNVLDDEGFEPGELEAKKGDAWEGEDEDDDALKVSEIVVFTQLNWVVS